MRKGIYNQSIRALSRVDEGIAPYAPHGTVCALLTHTALHFRSYEMCHPSLHLLSGIAPKASLVL